MSAIIITTIITAILLLGYRRKHLFLAILLFSSCFSLVSLLFPNLSNVKSVYSQPPINKDSIPDNLATTNNNEESPVINLPAKNFFQIIKPGEVKTKLKDVAGLYEVKDEVQDIIRFLNNPQDFTRLGAKAPKGLLLYGEPGTGKTMLARAIAGESGVSFIAVAGAQFDEEYIGVGASRVRELFSAARENAPCIIFIDEIDSLAHKRMHNDPAWVSQTVNQLLAEMDGLDNNKNQGVVVIGASNRLNMMDTAVLRPGRLDRHIKLSLPSLTERADILNVYLAKVVIDKSVNANTIAKMTMGFSGAELANLVNEAAICATKNNKPAISKMDFDTAKDRIILGSKNSSLKVNKYTRKVTAYHEAGHALIGYLLKGKDSLYKVTITPRGPSLGHTSFEPSESSEYSISFKQLEAEIATALAGRIAEEIAFGANNITTGAESDLQTASNIAYKMVTKWGYSKRVGLLYQDSEHSVIADSIIETEIQAIIKSNYLRTKCLLQRNKQKLNKLAKRLLAEETLDAEQIQQILK